MTAAVARPPLFRHLVASNPEHEKGSVAATISAVALHGALVVAAVLLSARVTPPAERFEPTEIVPLHEFQVAPAPARRATGGGGAAGPIAPVPSMNFEFPVPTEVPTQIPAPGSMESVLRSLENMLNARPATPGAGVGTGTGDNPGDFVPITVAPELLNRAEIARAMLRMYPQTLMQAGIGGTVFVWLHLDESGAVLETRVKQGSGYSSLDDAALKVAQTARFSPAYNRDQRVRVWVELPVVFGAR